MAELSLRTRVLHVLESSSGSEETVQLPTSIHESQNTSPKAVPNTAKSLIPPCPFFSFPYNPLKTISTVTHPIFWQLKMRSEG